MTPGSAYRLAARDGASIVVDESRTALLDESVDGSTKAFDEALDHLEKLESR